MTVRSYIGDSNEATLQCPECAMEETVNLARYKTSAACIKVRCNCKCGHTFQAILERRKYIRKDTNLSGSYVNTSHRGVMSVINISLTGVQLAVMSTPKFKTGDTLTIDFILDDTRGTHIRTDVVVRSIRGHNVGCEFAALGHYKLIISSYLLQ
jgi:hypothetical protein